MCFKGSIFLILLKIYFQEVLLFTIIFQIQSLITFIKDYKTVFVNNLPYFNNEMYIFI